MSHPTMLDRKQTALVVIDLQEAFRSVINEFPLITEKTSVAVRGFHILEIPILVTEQYPKGLGKTAEEISVQRQLVQSTIEGHLAHFVRVGMLDAHRLLPKQKISTILDAIKEIGGTTAMPIKEKLGDDYSFAEIRVVLNYLLWMKENNIEV